MFDNCTMCEAFTRKLAILESEIERLRLENAELKSDIEGLLEYMDGPKEENIEAMDEDYDEVGSVLANKHVPWQDTEPDSEGVWMRVACDDNGVHVILNHPNGTANYDFSEAGHQDRVALLRHKTGEYYFIGVQEVN